MFKHHNIFWLTKSLFVIPILLLCSLSLYGIRIINDSNTDLIIHTYNSSDQLYVIPYSVITIKSDASFDLIAHDSETCKLQMWVMVNGNIGTRLIAPERIYHNYDIIIIHHDLTIYSDTEGTNHLYKGTSYPPPTSPKFPYKISEGEGLTANESIKSKNGEYLLKLENGDLKIICTANSNVCWESGTNNVEVVKILDGSLELLDIDNRTIIEYGTYRPDAFLSFESGCGIKITTIRGFQEWHIGNPNFKCENNSNGNGNDNDNDNDKCTCQSNTDCYDCDNGGRCNRGTSKCGPGGLPKK